MTKFKYERKNEKDSGRCSKMTPSCKWPIQSNIIQPKARENMRLSKCWVLLSPYSISAVYIIFILFIFRPIIATVKRAMNQSEFEATRCNRKRGKTCIFPTASRYHQHTLSVVAGAIKFSVGI